MCYLSVWLKPFLKLRLKLSIKTFLKLSSVTDARQGFKYTSGEAIARKSIEALTTKIWEMCFSVVKRGKINIKKTLRWKVSVLACSS